MNRVLNDDMFPNYDGREASNIQQLIDLGRRQGYVSFEDILAQNPEAEQSVDFLEDIFAAFVNAGVAYIEQDPGEEPAEHELSLLVEVEETETSTHFEEDDLAGIDITDSIGLYIRQVAQVPLLTQQEERDLAQRIERGRKAREELASGTLTPLRRKELHSYIEDGWRARDHLIVANSRLVISVARKYMGRGVPFLDLIQEGNIGLMRATKKFDYARGFKFSTYATWWIRQAVTRALSDQSRTIRVPVHMGDQINRMMRAQNQLKQTLGRDPTLEELAYALQVEPKKVEYMLDVARQPLSLHAPVNEEEDDVLGDFIEDTSTPHPDESAAQHLLREQLENLLDRLPPREARILQLRYGLLDGHSLTLNEVGRKLGVTRERVRQIEAQALRRLRSQVNYRDMNAYME